MSDNKDNGADHKATDQKSGDDLKTFDMYHTRSHWSVVLGVAFIVAFLLFVLFLMLFGTTQIV